MLCICLLKLYCMNLQNKLLASLILRHNNILAHKYYSFPNLQFSMFLQRIILVQLNQPDNSILLDMFHKLKLTMQNNFLQGI